MPNPFAFLDGEEIALAVDQLDRQPILVCRDRLGEAIGGLAAAIGMLPDGHPAADPLERALQAVTQIAEDIEEEAELDA